MIGGSYAEYGTDPRNLDRISYARETKFVDGGSEHAVQYVHRAVMSALSPATVYCKLRTYIVYINTNKIY